MKEQGYVQVYTGDGKGKNDSCYWSYYQGVRSWKESLLAAIYEE